MLTAGRLGVRPMPSLVAHVHGVELATQQEAIDEYVQIDLAHVLMLAESGALRREQAVPLLRALLRLLGPDPEVTLPLDPKRGGVLPQMEAYLRAECGEAGGMIQLARSRIDQNAEAVRLVARRETLAVLEALLEFGEALLRAADRWAYTPAPGYTHLQHSQPGTLGHFFNAHYWVASRSIERLREGLRRTDLCSLGGAALVGTDWPIDRSRTAELLGHPGIVLNARDAGIFSIDVNAELAGNLALLLGGLARLAGDLYFWCASEVGLVRLHAGLCGTSSMMPQKRNPYALERVRALAGEAVGWPASHTGLLKMATSTDCDQVFAVNRAPEMGRATVGALRLMTDAVDTLEVDEPALRRAAGSQWSTASALADALVRSAGLSFRAAHDVVARMVRLSEEVGPASLPELLTRAAAEAGVELDVDAVDPAAVLDVDRFLATRTSAGGCAPERLAELAEAAGFDLAAHTAAVREAVDRVAAAREQLVESVRAYLTDGGDVA